MSNITKIETMELKAIKVHAGLSEETHAYTANLYINGKHVLECSNGGHGGPDSYTPTPKSGISPKHAYDLGPILFEYLKRTGYVDEHDAEMREFGGDWPDSTPDKGFSLLESWCCEQVNKHLVMGDMKRSMRKSVLFIKPGAEGVYTKGYKGGKAPDDRLFDIVAEKYPGAQILNNMDAEAALQLFRANV